MIEGVKTKQLKVIPDERGRLMEMLRNDDEVFIKFGQAYLTTAYPGAIKGWHYHKTQRDNFVAVTGMMKVVLYDNREDSKTYKEINEFFIGDHNRMLVHIPELVLHGFKCISETEAMVINYPTEVYNYKNPDEFRIPLDDKSIPYDWRRKDG